MVHVLHGVVVHPSMPVADPDPRDVLAKRIAALAYAWTTATSNEHAGARAVDDPAVQSTLRQLLRVTT